MTDFFLEREDLLDYTVGLLKKEERGFFNLTQNFSKKDKNVKILSNFLKFQ